MKTQNNGHHRSHHEIGEGIFDMSFINSLQSMSFEDAKKAACEKIESSLAKERNKERARKMLGQAHSLSSLMIATSNFSLSFAGYKVLA